MSVKASTITGIHDGANSVVLRDSGLAYSENHHGPGTRVDRKGVPYWETSGDFDWTFHVKYQSQGDGPFSVSIWGANGPTVGDVPLATVAIPANASGETRGIISAASLRGIPADEPLYLSVALGVASGSLDAGVTLERAN